MHVIFQVFNHEKLRSILQRMTIHLVEASPSLSAIQEQTLSATPSHTPPPPSHTPSSHYRAGQVDGVEVFWYRQLKEVPEGEATPTPSD